MQLGFSVEDIAHALDIRPAYVEAFERGELTGILGPGYVKSIATRYAACLGLEAEPLIQQLDLPPRWRVPAQGPAGNQARRERPAPGGQPPAEESQGAAPPTALGRRLVWGVVLATGIVALGLLLALGFVVTDGEDPTATTLPELAQAGAAPRETTTTSVARLREDSSSAVPAAAPAQSPPRPTSTSLASSFALRLEFSDRVWLRVTEEDTDRELFDGIREAGEELTLEADGPLLLNLGLPEGVSAVIDGRPVVTPAVQHWRVTSAGAEALD
jgi:cytoskeletal protein RodZ